MKKYLKIIFIVFLMVSVSTGWAQEKKSTKKENGVNLLKRSARLISELDLGSSGTPPFLKRKKRIKRHLRRIIKSSNSKLQKKYLLDFTKCLEEEKFENIPVAEFFFGTEIDLLLKYDKKSNSLSAIALKTSAEETESTGELFDKIRIETGRGILGRNIRFFPTSNVIKISELVYPENLNKRAIVLNSAVDGSTSYPGVILLKNVLEKEFVVNLKPIAKQILKKKIYEGLNSGLLLRNVFLHHVAHYTIPFNIKGDGENRDFSGAALKELLLEAEEIRADLNYLTIISLLDEKTLINKGIKEETIYIFLLEKFAAMKDIAGKSGKSHSLTLLNSLYNRGGIGVGKGGKKLVVDLDLLTRNIKDLEALFDNIFKKGNYRECKAFFKKYSETPENIKKLLKISTSDKVE